MLTVTPPINSINPTIITPLSSPPPDVFTSSSIDYVSPLDGQATNLRYQEILHVEQNPHAASAAVKAASGRFWERGSKALVDPLKSWATHLNNAQKKTDQKYSDDTIDGRVSGWLQNFMFKPGSVGSWFIPKKYAHSGLSAEEKKGLADWSAGGEAAQSYVKFVFYAKSASSFMQSFRNAKFLKDPVERANTRLDALGSAGYNFFLFFDKIGHMSAQICLSTGSVGGALAAVGLGRLSCLTSYLGAFVANGATTRKTLHSGTMGKLRSQTQKVLDYTNQVSSQARVELKKAMGSSTERAIIHTRGALLSFVEYEGKFARPKTLKKGQTSPYMETCHRLYGELHSIQEALGGESDEELRLDLLEKLNAAVYELRQAEPPRCQDLADIIAQAITYLEANQIHADSQQMVNEKDCMQLRKAVFDKAQESFDRLHENAIKIAQVSAPNRRSIMEDAFGVRSVYERIVHPNLKREIADEVARLEAENKAILDELRAFSAEKLFEIEQIAGKNGTVASESSVAVDTETQKAQRMVELMAAVSPSKTAKDVTDLAAKAAADSRFGESLGKAIPFSLFYASAAYQYLTGQADELATIANIKGAADYPLWAVGGIALCTAMGSYGAFKAATTEFKAERQKTGEDRSPAKILYYGAVMCSTGLMLTASLPAAHPVTRSLGIGIYALGVITEVMARSLPDLKKHKWYRDWARKHHFEREVDLVKAERDADRTAKLPPDARFSYTDSILL